MKNNEPKSIDSLNEQKTDGKQVKGGGIAVSDGSFSGTPADGTSSGTAASDATAPPKPTDPINPLPISDIKK